MTKKLWFQLGVGILLTLIIITYLVEVNWLFRPISIVLKTIFLPLLLGGVLFYVSLPLKQYLERKNVRTWISMLIIMLILVGFLTGAVLLIGPPIVKQVNDLIVNAPEIARVTNDFIFDLIERVGNPNDLPVWVQDAIKSGTEFAKNVSLGLGNWIVQLFQSVVQGTVVLVLTPFFFFFMLKDHEKFVPFVTKFFTGETKKWLTKTLNDVDFVLSSYIRGQLLISVILAIMLFIGYYFVGLRFALLLSVFALFMNIIPFFGPWIAFVPALLTALFQDPKLVIMVSLITLVAQQIDANVITPNIMGKTLSIHPLTIITLLLAAGKIAGFFGVLLAVPAYAVAKTVISNIYDARQAIKETAIKDV